MAAVAIVVTALAFSVAALVAVYVYQHYVRHLPELDRLVHGLPPEEANPPEALLDLVQKLDPNVDSFVTTKLVGKFSGSVPMGAWHARKFIWWQLLPFRLAPHDRLALYVHFMPFEGGQGLSYGAQHYYGKAPAQLSQQEALELFVISVSPSGNSPTRNPERFKAAVERFRARLDAPAA